MTIRDRCGWMLSLLLVGLAANSARAGFTVVDLGVTGTGIATIARGVSDSGAIAGQATGPSGTFALVSTGGSLQAVDVSTLPGSSPLGSGSAYSVAVGVNSSGNVVGTYLSSNAQGTSQYHAFATVGGVAKDFGTLTGSTLQGATTYGVAINSSGTVLATAYQGGSSTAYRSSEPGSAAAIVLPTGGTNGSAAGLNDLGTAVGTYINGQGAHQVFLSTMSQPTINLMAQYQPRGFGSDFYASGIANNGDVAGYGEFNGQWHAFLAKATPAGTTGQFIDIGTTGGFNSSQALALNALGEVVGTMNASGYNSHAFLYSQTLGLFDLNSLLSPSDARLWTLTTATGINNNGQIVGQGIIGGQMHAFLLTPTAGSLPGTNFVPAPPAVILVGLGLIVVGGWARFRPGRTAGRDSA